nr:copia protein [Tanacetum cinerariifolium]
MAWNLGLRMKAIEKSHAAIRNEVSSLRQDTLDIKSMMTEIYQAFKGQSSTPSSSVPQTTLTITRGLANVGLTNKPRQKYVSYPRFISCALEVLLGSKYTQDESFRSSSTILSNLNFLKDPSKVTPIELTAFMVAVNKNEKSVNPLSFTIKKKKGKSQTMTSTVTQSRGPEASGSLPQKRKNPKSKKPPIKTKVTPPPKPTKDSEQSHSGKDSGGNKTLVYIVTINPTIADLSGTGAKYHVNKTQSTRLSIRDISLFMLSLLFFINSIEKNSRDLPEILDQLPFSTKWVFDNKKDKHGITTKNKARLVAQGHSQEEEINYDETFAPVARIEAIRMFLAFATYMNFRVFQMYVKSAFRNGKLKEEVYVKQPPTFESSEFPDYVCKLDKSLYGLKQAPKPWYETLSTFLIQNKIARGRIDNTLFICKSKGDVLLVYVYVDDIIFGPISYKLCKQFENLMTKKFEMSMM